MSVEKILIVDDEEHIRSLMESYLTKQGFTTYLAQNGKEAFEIITTKKPDLIFLDIQLPGMDGVEILKEVKKKYPDIAVIMISGNATEEIAKETLEIGAFEYINKPVDLDKVSEVICCVELLWIALD